MTPELDSISIPEPQTKGPECSTNAVLESAVPGCLTELPPAPEQPKTTFDLKADTDDAQSTDAVDAAVAAATEPIEADADTTAEAAVDAVDATSDATEATDEAASDATAETKAEAAADAADATNATTEAAAEVASAADAKVEVDADEADAEAMVEAEVEADAAAEADESDVDSDEVTLADERRTLIKRVVQIRKQQMEYKAERTAAFDHWLLQHQEARTCSLVLKPELADVLAQRPVGLAQVNALRKALRSHPIALVEESLQESTHGRSLRETLHCDYQAFILGQLKLNECQAYYHICLSSLGDNPIEPTGSCYEPRGLINWARALEQSPYQLADYVSCAWDETDLAAFECCDYELGEKPKPNDVQLALMALEQRSRNLTLEMRPPLDAISQLLNYLDPSVCGIILRKLQPLFLCDSCGFVEGVADLGRTMIDCDYPLVKLLALEDDEPGQAEEFLRQSERPLTGALRKLAERNDELWAQEQAEAEGELPAETESGTAQESASAADKANDSLFDNYDPSTDDFDPAGAELEAMRQYELKVQAEAEAKAQAEAKARALAQAEAEIVATLKPYNYRGIPEAYAQVGLELLTPEPVYQEFRKADITPLPAFCMADAETWKDRDGMTVWRVVGKQRYGTREMGMFYVELLRPVFVNGFHPECWYGCRRGTTVYTYVYPEAIRECDAQGVPQAQIIGADDLASAPRVEWFIEESLTREQLSEHFLRPAVVKAELAYFRENWLDTNVGSGFAVSTDPHSGAYYGYETPEDLARVELSAEDLAAEYAPLQFDQLSLEQIVVASTTPTTAHPYGLVAEVGLSGYVNCLNYLKAKACQCTHDSTQFARCQQLIAALEPKLSETSIDLQDYADRVLNFRVSCDFTNLGSGVGLVKRELGACDWVANQAQLNFLLEARRAALAVQRDLKELKTLCTGLPYYEPHLQRTEAWGHALSEVQRLQLQAGQAVFNYPCAVPEGKLPPMLSAKEDALLRRNRACLAGQHYPSGLTVSMCLPPSYKFMGYDCFTPLYLKRSAQPLAPKPLLIDLQRGIMTQGAYWAEHVAQSYGTLSEGACISLVRPVLTNEVDPKCWYGAFPGRDPGTVIVPEAIKSCNAEGIPNALVLREGGYDSQFAKPLIAQLLGAKASELSSQLVSAELAATIRANFERDWRDDNAGKGFEVTTDSTLPEFYGYPDVLGSLTRADVDHFCLGHTDPEIENYNAESQRVGALIPGAGLIYFDQLMLEQIYTAPLEPCAGFYYGPVAHIAFPDVINALTIISEFMMPDPCCSEDRKAQLQLAFDQVESLLKDTAPRVAWFAESALTFQASCAFTNGNLRERQVDPDLLHCDWVANRAQLWQLFTARRANQVAKLWYQVMIALLVKAEVPVPAVAEDAHSCLGLQYEHQRHAQLLAGQCYCDYGTLPMLPQQRLIAEMNPEDNQRFISNRYRYEARKLGLAPDADERTVFKTLHEHAQSYDQELARTFARNRGEDQEQAVLYGSAPKNVESVLKSTLDLGLEMTSDVGKRVRKYVDENLLDVTVKDLSGEVGAKVKDLIDSGSSKVSDLFGRFIKRK